MKKLGLIIIDDEQPARELLKSILSDVSWISVLAEAESVDDALQKIVKLRPDLILLDVQMPGKDGFVLIEELLSVDISLEVVFITAFEQYAIQAIKASAFDYLLKPVRRSDLIDTIERLHEKKAKDSNMFHFEALLSQLSDIERIKLKDRTGFSMVDPKEILFCKADSNYTVIYLNSGKTILATLNLGKVHELLPYESFAKISRSAIVNITYISRVDRKSMQCEVNGDQAHLLSLSKSFIKDLERKFENYFNGIIK